MFSISVTKIRSGSKHWPLKIQHIGNFSWYDKNKDKNVHRFALSAKKGNFWRKREREKEREREKKREREREMKREKERVLGYSTN